MENNIENIVLPEGLAKIVAGYLEYAKEVVMDRALVGIDGLKPSQRRILVTMKEIENIKHFTKCAAVVGSCMKLHPHGDRAIYDTLCRMTDVSEILNIPLITGKGKFAKVYSVEPSAAYRYTECKPSPIVTEFFGDEAGVIRVDNYDNSRTEPELLGVSFPSILCNPTEGIAVGISSNIPAFNFEDVLNATIDVIKTGKIHILLAPDYPTGGEYVYNEDELRRLIRKGKGAKIKLRGKWRIEGRTIIIEEIPYYTNIQRIATAAEKIQGVIRTRDLTGLSNGKTIMRLDIECRDKATVPSVLNCLLRDTDLQMTITASIAVIINGEPRVVGIEELLQEWVSFRKGVLQRKYNALLTGYQWEVDKYTLLTELLKNQQLTQNFITALSQDENKALAVIQTAFPSANEKLLDWVLELKIRALGSLSKAQAKLTAAAQSKTEIETALKDLDAVIIGQLTELKGKYQFPRRTVVTKTDYTFDDTPVEEVFDVFVDIQDKFISKERETDFNRTKAGFHCKSNDRISLIDNKGRLIRVSLSDIPLTATGTKGIYIPSYANIPDDFSLIDADVIENKKVGYVYSDGFASVLNLGEWVDTQRSTKLSTNGMPETVPLICGKYSLDTPMLYLCTDKGRFCFVPTSAIKEKSRTARTRIATPNAEEKITTVVSVSLEMASQILPTYVHHLMKFEFLHKGEEFSVEALEQARRGSIQEEEGATVDE